MTGRNITKDAIHGHTLASLPLRAEAAEAKLARIAALCDEAEHGATRWHDPLPVPDWVGRIRAALAGGAA